MYLYVLCLRMFVCLCEFVFEFVGERFRASDCVYVRLCVKLCVFMWVCANVFVSLC